MNPEEEARQHTKEEQDAEQSSEEGERAGEGGGDECENTGSADRITKNAEQRLEEGPERKQNAAEIEEFQFREPGARHVPGGTWLSQGPVSPSKGGTRTDGPTTQDMDAAKGLHLGVSLRRRMPHKGSKD
ncbi:hypothetical protein NDU88_005474 [Pleurodeles waltl]|uniref:Uncharacterized protein n=1 Tax=Pleurodeles waltl TaxID=8319 RepID=A0AAV7MAL3_PLEWA|nr:hypothetical protein NDU88_005474 [Pleurodeles waltl]